MGHSRGSDFDMEDDIRDPAEHRISPWLIAFGVTAIVVGASLALVLPEDSATPTQVTVNQ
jgi:hypothetical protein